VADLAIAPQSAGAPRVRVFAGPSLFDFDAPPTVADFFAGDPNSRNGIVIEAANLDGDPFADLLVSELGGPIQIYDGRNLDDGNPEPTELGLPGNLGGLSLN